MPSTYSPDLRIELIATGEQAGTWGTTTNTNLGTLIEDAIAGYVSVSITSADQALTASNGTADQARNMIVNLTTTTSANFNVYVPPANKFYVIRNSSAYQATIFCSTVLGNTTAAGTGIAIPAGKETIVFSDGTNIVSATDYLPALSLGTDLAVADGGTGISSATAYALLCGGTTSTGAFQSIASVGTAGQILTSNGAGALPTFQAAGGGFPSGTLMLFQQTAAPTGWTKQTTHDNKALRVVSGTASSGGSVNFTTAFASQAVNGTVGNTTLSTSQIPSHTHVIGFEASACTGPFFPSFGPGDNSTPRSSGATGGGGAHNHSFTGTAINLAVQYVDLIIASAN
jgi:hypothetical protein